VANVVIANITPTDVEGERTFDNGPAASRAQRNGRTQNEGRMKIWPVLLIRLYESLD
jgi:hypothetical protein